MEGIMAKQRVFIFIIVALLAVVPLFQCTHKPILYEFSETPDWFLHTNPAPLSASLTALTDSIIPNLIRLIPEYIKYKNPPHWQIDSVGIWSGMMVVDIFHIASVPNFGVTSKEVVYRAVKATAIELFKDKYRLIYLAGTTPGDFYFESSKIVKIGGTEVLYTRSQESGTGCFFDERYWTWSEEDKRPIEMFSEMPREPELDTLIPPGHEIWKGGTFSIDDLSEYTYTWRKGDGNCCPSGGSYSVKYAIVSGRLVVKRAIFDYSDLEERALWSAKRSADSLYLKQPPRIFEADTSKYIHRQATWLYYNVSEGGYYRFPRSMTLDTLSSFVRNSHYARSPHSKNQNSEPEQNQVRSMGRVDNREVVQIKNSLGKIIAIEAESSKYRPIYLGYYGHGDPAVDHDSIITFDGEQVIAIKDNSSHGERGSDHYWIWDKDDNVPISLYSKWVLEQTINRTLKDSLPAELSVRKYYGRWDLYNLLYETFTWRKDDSDSTPSGGKLLIQFGIREHRLVPVSYTFDPNDLMKKDENSPASR